MWDIIMDDFAVLVGVLASGSLAINLYLIKSVATLCEKVARLEGKLSSQAWETFAWSVRYTTHTPAFLMETELIGLVGIIIMGCAVILKVGTHASNR